MNTENPAIQFLAEHRLAARRYFLKLGSAGVAAWACSPSRLWADDNKAGSERDGHHPLLQAAIDKLEPFFTPPDDFRDVSRGKPVPHKLSDADKKAAGLTRDTWQLEVVGDPDPKNKPKLRTELTRETGTALKFEDLLKLGEKHAVRFAKVMTCLNIGCPLGTGIWEGVPLRNVFWLTKPRQDVRRVFYHGFHNDKPEQLFQSSLPLDRVLEDPYDLPPVILCYKLNGQWLSGERGGPVRIVVPEGYGFKSIKWLQRITLTNLFHANDTYAKGNNDVDSRLKSFAATLSYPAKVKSDQPIPVTGYAQVGISGVKKVQFWLHDENRELPPGDKYFQQAPWQDASILPPPADWGGKLPDNSIPQPTLGFDADGKPQQWPMRLAKIHWAGLLPPQKPGKYTLRCRTVDDKGLGQPLPRPFRKSGHAAVEQKAIRVEA